jgi:hypothetical protein
MLIFGFHYINPFLELVNSHVAKIATNFPITLRPKNHMGFDSSTNIATHRPRQGKVDNRLLPGKTVKVSGKG